MDYSGIRTVARNRLAGNWLMAAFTLGIGYFFLQPYIETSDAVFYRQLAGPVFIAGSAPVNAPSSAPPEFL